MAKYRRREAPIEAHQWQPGKTVPGVTIEQREDGYVAHGPDGEHPIPAGPCVFLFQGGTFIVLNPDDFERLYEPA